MTERRQFRAIKGTRDILPPDSALWNWFEHTAREVFESYNFGEIRLPVFEETELFARSIGVETDVVSKEMYTFEAVEPPLAAIDALLRYISVQKVAPRDSPAIARLKADLQELRTQVTRSDVAQELAKNPANHQRLSVLELGVGQLGRVESLDGTSGFQSEFMAVVREIQNSAETLILGQSTTLRPEATASVCRAYIEHNMQALPGNQKLYYIGPMFRRERPQKGRFRQFYQIGAEVLGQSDAPAIDAEVLEMLLVFFNRVALTRTTLYINSIGDKNCRPQYVELLRNELRKVKDRLKEDSQRRVETNPLRVLDSKIPEEQPVIETLPRISDHLCDDCRAHFAKLKEELNVRGIEYKENWRLVRGLDYYTRTTFEVTAEGLGSQNAICGGGRYDGLVELLGGPPTKGIGFAIGTDRSILSIEESGNSPKLGGLAVYIAWMGQASYPAAVSVARKLRAAGLAVELPPEEMKFKKSLGLADKLGARYAVIIGEDEVASRTFTLKRLADGDQKKLAEGELLEYLESERRR
jgi:histidyl-tRNA synthetase